MRLAAFLLILVAFTHYGYPLLAANYAHPEVAARGIYYVARGVEGACLFGLCGLLSGRSVVVAICALGAIEEAETAVCRLSFPIDEVKTFPLFEGICGAQYYALGLWALVCLALFLRNKNERTS